MRTRMQNTLFLLAPGNFKTYYIMFKLTWNPPRYNAAPSYSGLSGNELVTTRTIDVTVSRWV
jgi:hypothetical protein